MRNSNESTVAKCRRSHGLCGWVDGWHDRSADHAIIRSRKQQGLLNSPNGIVGSETAFAILYTRFVKTGIWPLTKLIDWLSEAPKQVFRLSTVGQLRVGDLADIAVFDLAHREKISATVFLSQGHNSPFIGQQVYGNTLFTLVNGQIVYRRY